MIEESEFYNKKDILIPFTIKSLDKIHELWNFTWTTVSNLFESVCEEIRGVFEYFNDNQLKNLEIIFREIEMYDTNNA